MAAFTPKQILSGWYRVEETVLSLLLFLMIILACLQIGMRTMLSSGIAWADPLLRYLVLWTGLLGAAVATRRGKHIAIDLISHLVHNRISRWFRVVTDFFSLTICLLLTRAATIFVVNEASFGDGQIIFGMSSWQLNLIFPISFGLISLYFLIRGIDELGKAFSNKAP
jgi:TRAP-type C4-dicarboxylate transport system permease small subunit